MAFTGDDEGCKQVGDNARKGAVKKRTQLKNPLTKTSTKRNKVGAQFMAQKERQKVQGRASGEMMGKIALIAIAIGFASLIGLAVFVIQL
jgi:hypothetical protein